MEGVLSTFQSVLNTKEPFLSLYLNGYKDHNALESSSSRRSTTEIDNVIQAISSFLTKSNTRECGLQFFVKFSSQLQIEFVEPKFNLWMSLMLKACNPKEIKSYGHLIFVALERMVHFSKKSVDLEKAFVSNYLTKVLEASIREPGMLQESMLVCIETCLRLYPGPSMHTRTAVQGFLNKFLDESNQSTIVAVGRCYHMLQQVKIGGNQKQNINTKDMWKLYQLNLVTSLHNLLKDAFANCRESTKRVQNDANEKSDFNGNLELSSEPSKRIGQIFLRFRNVVDLLIVAIREPYPVAKLINPKKIMDLIVRGVAVTFATIKRNAISDNFLLAILLPEIHMKLLQLLEALILILDGQMRPYNKIVLSILIDELAFTSTKDEASGAKFCNLRIKAYELISLWCRKFSFSSRFELYMEHLITEINKDITPPKNELGLMVMKPSIKHLSKKARRNLDKEKTNIETTYSSDNVVKRKAFADTEKRKICCAAMICLGDSLASNSIFISPTLLKKIYVKILEISSVLYEVTLLETDLYDDWRCRYAIYKTFALIVKNPNVLCCPPTELILHIVKVASCHDKNAKIREYCKDFSLDVEKILHPQKETLLFTIERDASTHTIHSILTSWKASANTNDRVNAPDDEGDEPLPMLTQETRKMLFSDEDESIQPVTGVVCIDDDDSNEVSTTQNTKLDEERLKGPSECVHTTIISSDNDSNDVIFEDVQPIMPSNHVEAQKSSSNMQHNEIVLNDNSNEDEKMLMDTIESAFVDELG